MFPKVCPKTHFRDHVGSGTAPARADCMNAIQPRLARPFLLLPLVLSLNGCRVVGGIFKAGVWVGVIAVVAVIALVVWGARALSR